MTTETKRFEYEKIYFWIMIGTIVLMALGAVASKNFYAIISKPDNIPIAIMLVIVEFFLWLSFKQAASADEHTRRGERHKIYEDMIH